MATRNFHWSSVFDCVMHETDGLGNTLVTYTHEPSQYGPLLSENRGGSESYRHYDALGSTTMLTDNTGAVTDTFQYDAWGNEVAHTGTTETPYRWCGMWGYQYDQSTGGYYIRERTYQPTVARWMSVDPLPPSLSVFTKYVYAFNSSAVRIDPSGLFCGPPPTECDTIDVLPLGTNTECPKGYRRIPEVPGKGWCILCSGECDVFNKGEKKPRFMCFGALFKPGLPNLQPTPECSCFSRRDVDEKDTCRMIAYSTKGPKAKKSDCPWPYKLVSGTPVSFCVICDGLCRTDDWRCVPYIIPPVPPDKRGTPSCGCVEIKPIV